MHRQRDSHLAGVSIMDPILSIAQGVMNATLNKIVDQKDQTLEDGQKDNRLRDDLLARADAAGLHPDKSGDGPTRTTRQTG
jgi:hypothetical protein